MPALTAPDIRRLAAASGAAGGLVFVVSNIKLRFGELRFLEDRVQPRPLILFGICSILSGAGSAVALLFVLHFLQLLKTDDSADNTLFLASACLIAGIAAQRLIPRYTDALEQKVDSLARLNEQTREIAEETSLIAKAQSALRRDSPSTDKLKVADLIRQKLRGAPMDRTLTMYLGRLLRHGGQINLAIDELTKFIQRKESRGEFDKDYADVLYNLACYHAVEAKVKQSAEHRAKALDYLKKSVAVLPSNKKDAGEDGDFDALHQDHEFLNIITP